MSTHSIHIEWDYDQYSAPVDSELAAYRLYKEGVKACQFDYPYDFAGDCTFASNDGLFNFTLTAIFEDGSESPHSAPFPFLLGSIEAPKADSTLNAVFEDGSESPYATPLPFQLDSVEAPNAGTLIGVYRLLLE